MADDQDKLTWRKSRFCATNACVEVARDDALFLVRDSANPDGGQLAFNDAGWSSFIAALRSDEGGLNGVER
ncbi:DUF397 domain-containing protein [Dactylosporangium sp. NPDC049525]|uniref:DUF397 domain-containing protein n=1 Tax=Dactylosporangium sp. NPDC049525 TaxID=3154730 RepID=UPI00343E41D7